MAPSRFLRNLTLSAKFKLILGIQLGMLLLLSIMGWWALGQFNQVRTTADARGPKLQALANLRDQVTFYRGRTLAALVSASKNTTISLEQLSLTEELHQRLEEAIQKAKALTLTPDQAAHLAKAIAAQEAYRGLVATSQGLAAQDKDGNHLMELFTVGKPEADTARGELDAIFQDIQRRSHEEALAANAVMARIQVVMTVILLLAILLGVSISLSVGRHVAASTQAIDESMARFSRGDLTKAPAVNGADELGTIARMLGEAIRNLNGDIRAIAGISEQNASAATQLSATTDQLNTATREVSHGVESQRTAIAQSSLGLAEVNRNMGEIQNQAREAGEASATALTIGSQGLAEVEESQKAMQAIEESSTKVGRITSVIADIARQTNLLSLNAAIEAAKAGAQGKGFAVVAEEIRKLAERSAAAAKEINLLIQESTERVGIGAAAVGAVSRALAALETSIQDNAARVQAIVSATSAQARATEGVVAGIETSAMLTERNASATTQLASSLDETNRTVEDLAQTANHLRELTSRFHLA